VLSGRELLSQPNNLDWHTLDLFRDPIKTLNSLTWTDKADNSHLARKAVPAPEVADAQLLESEPDPELVCVSRENLPGSSRLTRQGCTGVARSGIFAFPNSKQTSKTLITKPTVYPWEQTAAKHQRDTDKLHLQLCFVGWAMLEDGSASLPKTWPRLQSKRPPTFSWTCLRSWRRRVEAGATLLTWSRR